MGFRKRIKIIKNNMTSIQQKVKELNEVGGKPIKNVIARYVEMKDVLGLADFFKAYISDIPPILTDIAQEILQEVYSEGCFTDDIAHSQGRCSFSSPSWCSAFQHDTMFRLKKIIKKHGITLK